MYLFAIHALLLLSIACTEPPCTWSQAYWLLNSTQWPNNMTDSLCGENWTTLLATEATKMTLPANQLWVVASHQLITANLNMALLGDTYNASDALSSALLLIGDSLERLCSNVSQWPQDTTLYDSLDTVRLFNQGSPLMGLTTCANQTGGGSNAFYFYNSPDLIIISSTAGTNTSIITYSLLGNIYRFRQFLLSSNIVACLIIIPLLMIIIAIIMNRRRNFFARKDKRKAREIEMIS